MTQSQTSRLAKNTAALFLRQIFIVAINLYTIRIVLNRLGIEDFALYNVLFNVVMLGSFMTIALNTIIQRYFAFAMGKRSHLTLKQVHDAGMMMSLFAAVISVVGLETIGVWFVNRELVIAAARVESAGMLFQFLTLAFVLSIFSTFYSSVIMAHEDMHAFALISILDAVLRLAAALTLSLIASDRLVLYGVLLAIVALILVINFFAYSVRKYEECHPGRIRFEVSALREMLVFGGWTIFGQITTVSRSQAVTILVNQAFSPATVAARAIASSVGAQILAFSKNFSSALHPPIIKAHASGEKEETFSLIYFGSKVTFFLVWMATLPVIALAPGILDLWLGTPPSETVLFTQLALVENAIVAVSLPLMTAVRATGRIRLYELSLGSLQSLVLILSWVAIKLGAAAYVVYIVAIVINLLMFAVRLWLANLMVDLPVRTYSRSVLMPILLVVVVSSALVAMILLLVPGAATLSFSPAPLAGIVAIFVLSPIVTLGMGLAKSERAFLISTVKRKFSGSGGKR